ncbi:GSCOCG00009194001-RA-CDS [Cotesia congregata]|nr:GSCOCG00009194001-RA-CDS [Cotesia congregata]
MCQLTNPDQVRLKKIHQAVALSELRAFILNLKAGEDNQKAVAKGIMQSEEYILTSRLGFEETSDNFHACDPSEHIRGETFGEFMGLFQGLVVNEGHTNNKSEISKCGESCDKLDDTRIEKCFKPLDGYGETSHCHRKKCLGRLFECMSVQDTNVCELEPTSDRRFSWLWSEGQQKHYGKYDGDCEGNVTDIKDREGPSGICVTCLCTCAEEDPPSKATRTVSLLPQFADIKKNMVVTGVRFQENNKVFHVQIEESKLGPLGEILSGTSKWKKLDSFTYDPKNGTFQTSKRLRKQQLYDNLDYKIFNRDSRTVNLDKVETPYGEVIVGVSLVYSQDDDAVQIQILSWPFDCKTGELKDPINLEDEDVVHDWITWKNSPRKPSFYDNDRSEIELSSLDDPALAPKNQIVSNPNDKVKIGTTGYEVDMGQHTIPYITLQDVTYSDKKTALAGLELYYARTEGFGGFLGFTIQGYDFSKDFQNKMNQDDIDKYQADFDGQLPREIPVKDM